MGSLTELLAHKKVLLAVAAPAEKKAVGAVFTDMLAHAEWQLAPLDARFDLVMTGVSKSAAAAGVARVLDPSRHGLVLSVGIAGTLSPVAPIGSTVVATRCELADDGVLSATGFASLGSMGFGPFPPNEQAGIDVAPAVIDVLRPLADVLGPVATVSVCSGTDAGAARLSAAGFVAEAMEGAAVALVGSRLGVPFGEVRIISNTTGEREAQTWDMRGSLSKLSAVLGRLRTL